ncbi:LPXTG cell wall anchor domain-containing protein [Sutcliffiella cohnii]
MKKIIILTLMLLLIPFTTFAETITQDAEVDLYIKPHKELFNLRNVKPGDRAERLLTVGNSGKQNFNYIVSNKFVSGSEKFYNELLLKVFSGKDLLYEGMLHEFSKLDPRKLASKEEEDLTFDIEIPYELGNEFQGLATQFQFNIYVEGTLGGVLPVDNKLPTTSTGMFNYIIAGLVLVSGGSALYILNRRKNRHETRT